MGAKSRRHAVASWLRCVGTGGGGGGGGERDLSDVCVFEEKAVCEPVRGAALWGSRGMRERNKLLVRIRGTAPKESIMP